MEKAGLQKDNYCLTYRGPTTTAIVTKPCFTEEVANDAIMRVMKIVSHAAEKNTIALKLIVAAMSKLVKLQTVTQKAVSAATKFIRESSAFWCMMRAQDTTCAFTDTLAVDDVLICVLSHLKDAECYRAVALSCAQFCNSDVSSFTSSAGTSVMTGPGCPGTTASSSGVPIIRKDVMVGFVLRMDSTNPTLTAPTVGCFETT